MCLPPQDCISDCYQNNLLINSQGRVLVADFGMSRMLQEGGFATSKEPGGSIRWMAPELFKEGITHTGQSDLWAFGMTILVCD